MTCKILGTGSAEREWKKYNSVKSGQRHRLGSMKNKKNAVIYGVNCEERAKVRRAGLSAAGKLWEDEDFEGCKMNLYCQPIIDKLAEKKSGKKKGPRIFRAWRERWERKNDIPTGGNAISESLLVRKYGGLQWNDPDNQDRITTSHPSEMKFVRKRGNDHYNVYAITEQYDLFKKEEVQPDEWEP